MKTRALITTAVMLALSATGYAAPKEMPVSEAEYVRLSQVLVSAYVEYMRQPTEGTACGVIFARHDLEKVSIAYDPARDVYKAGFARGTQYGINSVLTGLNVSATNPYGGVPYPSQLCPNAVFN